jgi:hypothetical protein
MPRKPAQFRGVVVSCRFVSIRVASRRAFAPCSAFKPACGRQIHGLFLERSAPRTRQPGEMTCWCDSGRANREIAFGLATRRLRATPSWPSASVSISAGDYYGPRLRNRDVHHDSSVYLLARLRGHPRDGLIVGSAQDSSPPSGMPSTSRCPLRVRDDPVSQCHEVGRLVSERPEGIGPGLTPLGLMQAASLYSGKVGIR